MLRLLAKRPHDLVAARTRAVCRLHTTLCHLAEGHFPKRMTASQGWAILARIRPTDGARRPRQIVGTYSNSSMRPSNVRLVIMSRRRI